MMFLVQRHGKVCSSVLELPVFDFFCISIDHGNLADGRQVYKDFGAFLFQLKGFWMGAEFEIALEPFVGGGIESSDSPVAVPDIDAFRLRIIAKLVGIIWKFHRIQELVRVGIENLAGTIALVRNDNAIQIRKVKCHLRLYKLRLHAVDAPTAGHIKHFYGVMAIDISELTVIFIIDAHVVETALDIWHRNDPHQN